MSAPLLLIVDDSEAVLAYATAVLAREYALATATNGREALQKLRELRPAAVVLDLSMPELSGDEMLALLRADPDPALSTTPVIIVSSEEARGNACLAAGADAFLPKPARADSLKTTVARVLREADRKRRVAHLHVLLAELGARRVAIPLEHVRTVVLYPATRPLAVGLSCLREYLEVEGRAVGVLELAGPLRAEHTLPLWERSLVVVEHESVWLALSFDRVLDPIEVPGDQWVRREALVHDEHMLGRAVLGAVKTAEGPIPVLNAAGLFSRATLRRLRPALEALREEAP